MLSNSDKKQIQKIIKKIAGGYFFDEVQLEYQKMQKNAKSTQNCDKNDEILTNFENFDRGLTKTDSSNDIMKMSSNDCTDGEMVLVKKKVTSHFVPPDIRAIRLLLEINFEEDGNSIEAMSDDELLRLRKKLLEEYANENCGVHEND